jgi:hypothetical protein
VRLPAYTRAAIAATTSAECAVHPTMAFCPVIRDLQSSSFRLNVSDFCGIGGASRGCLGYVWEALGSTKGCYGVFRVCVVSETAQVELRS